MWSCLAANSVRGVRNACGARIIPLECVRGYQGNLGRCLEQAVVPADASDDEKHHAHLLVAMWVRVIKVPRWCLFSCRRLCSLA